MSSTPDCSSIPGDDDRLTTHQTAKVLNFSPSTTETQRAKGQPGLSEQAAPKLSTPPVGLLTVDNGDEPVHSYVTLRIDGDRPNEEGNRLTATGLAHTFLKHLRPLNATPDEVGMLAGDLENHAIAEELERLADDMELEATSGQLRETQDELESAAQDLREWADGTCETHAKKYEQMADELEQAARMTGFLAGEMDHTGDALRCLMDEEPLAATADKMRRMAKTMKRDSAEFWPATLMERLCKVGFGPHHAVHALLVIAETMEGDSKTMERDFNTGNWAVA